ncbi:Glycosyltransferase, catalytic subunit of cellulose synthase and poly-beta-1,6-N-acetylglucosamine synthase [Microbacterium hydrocarbonoxydans]|uniref:Glycosyltransferase, catalytic subunit of cellulose synthase and poly-beta-1,6-N-acetylglucosamine synthase n=2 Tax=Microbacterium hydrocarbonoxydans TaxID=273678 RepID=A0A1H4NNT4_9MICO|nr:glycosyltransferase family 2 protein [Microbacterium hydrocarbonoxydans]SEB96891.1 Glycosyltransferase, catalytic subunit of cellulose synthase and poly-beta-1,6-N-acetylglucosamine synthase [Microbacterium hydrocarbonoxydans]
MPDNDIAVPEPGVSFVMPVLNERAYLEHAIQSVLAQELPVAAELVLALGPSTDGTTELARRLAADDDRIQLVDNPAAHIPVGLNAAIRASRFATIVRVDAHSELSPGYAARALETLDRTGAANVGGVMRADGRTPFQKAVARLYNSPVGLGGGAYHGGTHEGEAESAYLGVMRREVLDAVGLFDETIRRGEDWELNLRIRQAGHLVWFDPSLSVTYWPRESWVRLARQFRATGAWRGELVRRFGRRNGIRFFAPPALVILVAVAVVVGVLQLSGVLSGALSAILSAIAYLPLLAYVLLVVAVAALPGGGGIRQRLWTLLVMPTMHLSWGLGFLGGVLRGARDTVDASRLGTRNTPLP